MRHAVVAIVRFGRIVAPMLTLAVTLASPGIAVAQTDPRPSWNDGQAKQTLITFVGDSTHAGGPAFVPPAERIAVFDNDGTLLSEQPRYFQVAFALEQVKAQAPKHSRPAQPLDHRRSVWNGRMVA